MVCNSLCLVHCMFYIGILSLISLDYYNLQGWYDCRYYFFSIAVLTYLRLQMSMEIGDGWVNLIKVIDARVKYLSLCDEDLARKWKWRWRWVERNGGWCGGPTHQPYLLQANHPECPALSDFSIMRGAGEKEREWRLAQQQERMVTLDQSGFNP